MAKRQKQKLQWLLLMPGLISYGALTYGNIIFKMGVPLSCASILIFSMVRKKCIRYDLIGIITALILSSIGDWFLSNKDNHTFPFIMGIAFYFLAHTSYLTFALKNGRPNLLLLLGIILPFLLYYTIMLFPAISEPTLSFAVLFYLLLSCLILAAAIGVHLPDLLEQFFILGISLLVLSDTLISFAEFLNYNKFNFLILPTYYLAHLIITSMVLMIIERVVD